MMQKRVPFVAAAVITILALVAGCGGQQASGAGDVREIRATISDEGFTPNPIEVKAGEKIKFVVENRTDSDQEFESDEAKIEEVVVPPGKTREIQWTAPSKAGEYEFEYYAPGTEENHGEIIVSE